MILIIIALYYKSAARLAQRANKVKIPFHSAAATILTTTTEMNEESSITLGRSLFYLVTIAYTHLVIFGIPVLNGRHILKNL
jgi:hypothetical protein